MRCSYTIFGTVLFSVRITCHTGQLKLLTQVITPAPRHSISQCCASPFGGMTLNVAGVRLSAMHIAVLVWREGSPQAILDVPLARAMKTIS